MLRHAGCQGNKVAAGGGTHIVGTHHAFIGVQGLQLEAVAGQGAGFIKHHGVHLRQGFQRLNVTQQHALSGQGARGRQHGRRGGQGQGTGTGDYQYRYRHHQSMCRRDRPSQPSTQHGGKQHSQ